MYYSFNHLEPVCNLDVCILFMMFPVYRPNSSRFEFGIAFLKDSSPVLAERFDWIIRRNVRPLTGEGEG